MFLLMKCHTPPGIDEPDYALVNLDIGLVGYITKKLALAKDLRQKDSFFSNLSYFDMSPQFMNIGPNEIEAIGKILGKENYDEFQFDSAMHKGWMLLPDGFEPESIVRMSFAELVVMHDVFYWSGSLKHGGMADFVETVNIHDHQFKEWVKEHF